MLGRGGNEDDPLGLGGRPGPPASGRSGGVLPAVDPEAIAAARRSTASTRSRSSMILRSTAGGSSREQGDGEIHRQSPGVLVVLFADALASSSPSRSTVQARSTVTRSISRSAIRPGPFDPDHGGVDILTVQDGLIGEQRSLALDQSGSARRSNKSNRYPPARCAGQYAPPRGWRSRRRGSRGRGAAARVCLRIKLGVVGIAELDLRRATRWWRAGSISARASLRKRYFASSSPRQDRRGKGLDQQQARAFFLLYWQGQHDRAVRRGRGRLVRPSQHDLEGASTRPCGRGLQRGPEPGLLREDQPRTFDDAGQAGSGRPRRCSPRSASAHRPTGGQGAPAIG